MKKTVSTTLSILLSFLCLNTVWAAVNPSDVIGRRIADSGYTNSTVKDWSSSSSVTIKEPKCAYINITGISYLPGPAASYNKNDIYAAKHVNLHAWLEIYDGQGNYMKKPAILNGQGNTSLWWFRYQKQNIAVDFCDSNWNTDNASEFTIGDWVKQDAFHLKANYTEYFRASNSVGYQIWEQVVADRQRPWQKEGVEADPNALCHPEGFPVVVYLNGEFKGVFSWTLKKHRKNMGLDKDKAKHVYIDGMLKQNEFWQGNITWSDFEVRNPKVLYSDKSYTYYGYACTELNEDNEAAMAEINKIGSNYKYITTGKPDYLVSYDQAKKLFGDPVPKYIQYTSKKGNKKFCIIERDKTVFYEYDADKDGRNQILYEKTAGYDPKNEDHVQSNKVNAAVKSLARSNATLNDAKNQGKDMRTEIEKLFDVESLIDYLVFSQVVSNFDGFNSNWQWFKYDKKWYVAPYDLDCLFGNWNVTTGEFLYSADWSRCNNRDYTLGAKATRGPFYWIQKYYAKDIVARYEQLRAKGVFSADNIANKMQAYYNRIGDKYFKAEHDKWDLRTGQGGNSFGRNLTANDGWKATYDWRGAFNDNDQSIIGEYDAGRTYYAGQRCTKNYMVWEATKTVKGVNPFKQMGVIDSIDRIRKWATRRIQLLDQNKGVVDPKDSYEIEITSAKMGTVYLPFSFNIPDGLKFYKITGVNGKSITLKEIYKVTEANESYLVMGSKGTYKVKGTYVSSSAEDDFYNESNQKGGNSENLLWGATKNTYVPTGGYVLQNKNGNVAFYRVPKEDYIQIEAYHAYLEIPATGKAPEHGYDFDLEEDDNTTDEIKELVEEPNFVEIEGYYTPSGARVDTPVKGFNIVKYTDGTTQKIFVR